MAHECTQLCENAVEVLSAVASCLRFVADRVGADVSGLELEVEPGPAQAVLEGNVEALQEFKVYFTAAKDLLASPPRLAATGGVGGIRGEGYVSTLKNCSQS